MSINHSSASRKNYMAKRREEIKATRAAYYMVHREEIRAKQKAYHASFREERKIKNKIYNDTHREERKVYYAAHKEERRLWYATYREKVKTRQIERRHGLSKTAFDALINSQGEACAICQRAEWGGKGPHVDHDHATGKIRGVLCFKCNMALGMIGDDLKIARAIIDYLENQRKEK